MSERTYCTAAEQAFLTGYRDALGGRSAFYAGRLTPHYLEGFKKAQTGETLGLSRPGLAMLAAVIRERRCP